MKNASSAERSALAARARHIAQSLPPLSRGPDGRLTPQSRQIMQKRIEMILKQNRAVGASVVLCPPDAPADFFHFGHARLKPRIPVTQSTCFRIASVSKLVMSFAALSLMEDGVVKLDEDISAYLGYPVRHPAHPDIPVTLRMLLTHSAAITDAGSYGTRGMQPGCTLRELLESPACWRDSAPGEAFHYSNLGAGAAGVVLERAAGMPFDDILKARVFDPLGIRASYDPRRIVPADDLSDGYSVRGFFPPFPPQLRYDAASLAARPSEAFDPERDYLIAAGRMITDSSGMEQLLRLLASKDGMGVLSGESLSLMRAPQRGAPGIRDMDRGLNTAFLPGVFPGFSPVGHQGVAYGMCAELFADPAAGACVGVMTSGVRLVKAPPLMRVGFDLLALGFAALGQIG
ncbi:MAG: beta-lactamase family protein [Clostridia bacterium]|nr:beta-lactamase family protein [Clostridia bacterium]